MNRTTWIAMALALAVSGLAQAQTFDSGSNGSFGAIDLKYPDDCPDSPHEVWIDLPPDGIIHATTVTIESCVLRFRNNARNTPVYLLAQGDVVVKGGGLYGPPYGKIDVSGFTGTSLQGGLPGPGGFPGGRPYVVGEEPGPGAGPGGGGGGDKTYRSDSDGNQDYSEWPGRGVYSTAPLNSPIDLPNDGQPYGSQLLMPLMGGSGGGGSKHFSGGPYPPLHGGGSGGGGAILIASNTQILLGGVATWGEYGNYIPVILAQSGQRGDGASGSGGAIRLVAPRVGGFEDDNGYIHNGVVSVNGHEGNHGRIRVDAIHHPVAITDGVGGSAAPTTIGRLMKTFLDITPRLDIIHAAGTDIPLDTATPVLIVLPIGAPAEQSITLRAEGFTGTVPVRVQALLENGEAIVIDDTISMSGGDNVATKVIPITLPENIGVRFYAWTRDE